MTLPDPNSDNAERDRDLNDTIAWLFGMSVRRRWWILLPACTMFLGVIAVLLAVPNRYTSEATLVVVRQQVPERYVVPNDTTDLTAQLQAMKREVLSRTRLLQTISDFHLYRNKTARLPAESLIELMLHDIEIRPLDENPDRKDFNAFKISFIAETPILAQQVTTTLTSLFINEHLRTQQEQSTNTTNFLHEQVEAKRKALEYQERRLSEFKMQHIGELPEQQQGNLGILAGLQSQLQNTTAAISRAQQQRIYLQSLLDGYTRQAKLPGTAGSVLGTQPFSNRVISPLEAAQYEVARLESERAALLTRCTADHPDVIKKARELASAQQELRHLKAATPTHPVGSAPGSEATSRATAGDDTVQDPAIAQIRGQLESNRMEIDNLSKEETQLKAVVVQYQNRINQTPVREQQQAGIVRDTEALRQEFADLQKKEQQSQLATNLEKQQGGQQFRLIDPPSLPAVPSSPKRLKLSLGGIAGGLLLGLALAFLVEFRNAGYYSEKELSGHFGPPLLISIPFVRTTAEERAHTRRTVVEWCAGSVLFLTVLAAEFYVYRVG